MAVLYEVEGPIARLTIDRPEAANSVFVEMALKNAESIRAFVAEDGARVLVVTGSGERAFCAGGAIESLDVCADHEEARRSGPLGFARQDPGKPTIAAVNGHCYGVGLSSLYGATSVSPPRTRPSARSIGRGASL